MANPRDLVYAELRRRLMSGRFLPGERLREEHIAKEMEVSRTPVRSAIQKLVADGLLRQEEHRGATVVGWTARDIQEAFDVRTMLEPYAAGIAAQNASAAEIDRLESINEDMLRAARSNQPGRVERVQQLNNQFHHALLDAAHSARLRALVSHCIDMPILIGSFYFYTTEDMLASVEHHRQIILALRERRRELTEAAMKYHLEVSRALFENQRETPQASIAAASSG